MSTVQEIEAAIAKLSDHELASLRSWFREFDAKAWDRQFEEDVNAGKLDELASEALQEFRAGSTTAL